MTDLESHTLSLFLDSNPKIDMIKCTWVSCSGSVYAHLVTVLRFKILVASNHPLRVHTRCLAGLVHRSRFHHDTLSSTGQVELLPDWESIRVSSATEAIVQCYLHENVSLYRTLANPADRCPRSCLQKVVMIASDSYGLAFLVGFDMEFYLIEGDYEEAKTQTNLHQQAHSNFVTWNSSARLYGKKADCLRQCMLDLEKAGIPVERGQAQGSMSQFAILTGPLRPLAAVDALYASREIIKRIALDFNLHATFIPRPFANEEPSRLHLHLSFQRSSGSSVEKVDGDVETNVDDEQADSFLAGVLKQLPALCAISMPTSQSYLQGVGHEPMGDFVAWGGFNHSVPLNEIGQGYWEVKSLDCTANVYLAVAAYIGAGLLGVGNKERLRSEDPGRATEELSVQELKLLGIRKRLPKNLREALSELDDTTCFELRQMLGHQMIKLYREVKDEEVKSMGTWSPEVSRNFYMYYF